MSQEKYDYRDLVEGDIVDFKENATPYKFGVVTGGFGMSTACIGSKIFGVFGPTIEQTRTNYKEYLKIKTAEDARMAAEMKEKGSCSINWDADPDYKGYTSRQPCKVVGHVDLKTGE